ESGPYGIRRDRPAWSGLERFQRGDELALGIVVTTCTRQALAVPALHVDHAWMLRRQCALDGCERYPEQVVRRVDVAAHAFHRSELALRDRDTRTAVASRTPLDVDRLGQQQVRILEVTAVVEEIGVLRQRDGEVRRSAHRAPHRSDRALE